jgi:hypothetical protein
VATAFRGQESGTGTIKVRSLSAGHRRSPTFSALVKGWELKSRKM